MLGISVYPYKEDLKQTKQYIQKAAQYGYQRLFTNLLQIEDHQKDQIINEFKEVIMYARQLGMEVILDVNPGVFEQLNISYQDLTFFKEMGATGIRLDSTFDGLVESLLTFDSTGLDLEINISNDTAYLDNIMTYEPYKKKIIGCHNFYPQRYTGLDYDYFVKCSTKFKNMGLRTAAFVNSHTADHGPHVFTDGLCTLEMHRDMDIVTQAKHLVTLGTIDDIIIANAFASDEELKRLSEVRQEQLVLDVVFNQNVTEEEKKIVLDYQHFNRGDISSYMIRSTYVKLHYKDKSIPANCPKDEVTFGDITIGNDSFGQYKGELNIVKKTMPDPNHYKNVVAYIPEDEWFLIQYIHPWTKFRFKERKS